MNNQYRQDLIQIAFHSSAILCLLVLCVWEISAAAGDLDPTFGNDGIVSTSFSNGPYFDTPRSILVQPDGKIIVCGEIIYDHPDGWEPTVAFFFARYNPNGTLDTSFGTNGKVIAPINSGEERVRKIALQPDGKFIAVGSRYINSAGRFAVNRYNSDGTLDASFGTGGKVVTQVGNHSSEANDVTVQPDGKIVVVGAGNGFAVVRYNPDGTLDTNFGEDGKVITQFNNRGGFIDSVMLQPDGKIVAAGAFIFYGANGDTFGFALVRYKADGSLDPSFGIGGTVVRPFPNSDGLIRDAVLQPDGRIVVHGNIRTYGTGGISPLIVRYNSNGSTDTDFAANGIFTPPIYSAYDGDIALQPNGKIITFGNSNGRPAVLRLNPNGSLDQGFGSNGITTAIFGNDYSFGLIGAIQPDGRILLLGTMQKIGDYHDIAIARFLADSVAPASASFDFDGDGRTDTSVFRPSEGKWYLNRSNEGINVVNWGLAGDKIVPVDFDGDGKTDSAVFRPSNGTWYVINSATNTFAIWQWGLAGDTPVPGDYDGDGVVDRCVFRPSENYWYVQYSNGTMGVAQFGSKGDFPVPTDFSGDDYSYTPEPADFDGDGDTDFAAFRNGQWQIVRDVGSNWYAEWGLLGDIAVPADYDNDGKADLAVFRPSNGHWYIINSSNQHITETEWGLTGDVPVPGDYDGDGKSDLAVYRNGEWDLLQTTNGISVRQWGLADDRPVPAAYLP